MHRVLLALIVAAVPRLAWSQAPLDRPAVEPGDSWTYRVTTERGPSGWNQITVTRVTSDAIFIAVRTVGSTQPPLEFVLGSDWSWARDVNGTQTVFRRPFVFPLKLGKAWDVTYTQRNPNRLIKAETFDEHYKVVGYEPVEVPAGKFMALKIEDEGQWHAQIAPQQRIVQSAQMAPGVTTMGSQVSRTAEGAASGRLYKAFWYVPQIKRWVKSVEESYSGSGMREVRLTNELESYKMAERGAQ